MTDSSQYSFPNTVIIGWPKCGTSSLFHWLSAHPDVCASSVKETKFLLDRTDQHFNSDWNYHDQGLEGYGKYFPCASEGRTIVLEATPLYVYQQTALQVLSDLPKVPTIIACLRKPSSRVYSMFQFARNNIGSLCKTVSFPEFVAEAGKAADSLLADQPMLHDALSHSTYANYIEPWITNFGDTLHFVLFEDLVSNTRDCMMRLTHHLGIASDFYDEFSFQRMNKSYRVRSPFLHRLNWVVKDLLPDSRFRQLVRMSYHKLNISDVADPMSDDDKRVLAELDNYFKPHNVRLQQLTGLDLEHWD